jgi:hypothetical protein
MNVPGEPLDLNEPWLSIRWNAQLRCVHVEFKAFATGAEFRLGAVAIVDAIRINRTPALITDNRLLDVVTSQDQLWIRDTWTPLAVKAGLKRIAVVLSQNGLGKSGSQAILSQTGNATFNTQTFGSVEGALAWVKDRNH